MEEALLKVNGISKKYHSFALNEVTFSLEPGYILGLTGRNGAGKTTLIKQLLHPETAASGSVTIAGIDAGKHPVQAKQEMGVLMEEMPFLEDWSLEKNGKLLGAYYEKFSQEAFEKYLRKFELGKGTTYRNLSRGMRMKFQLAFALAYNPKLLLMDEATGGLDVVFRKEFYYLLQEAVEQEMVSVIISTHVTEDLDKVADYVAFMEGGRMKFFESKEELYEKYQNYMRRLHGEAAGHGTVRLEDVIYHYDKLVEGKERQKDECYKADR
ncbi:MAG: ABC transporter ATP-binding protein [Lachnospiraceae bacterium]|nr:ABC transporter ATP-binding protein [Lachnospiraceae bacterium]